jgi:class 3 adenylate cyclase
MNCPTCQAALPEDAAFCGHCGGALRSERTCARCGRSNSPEMRFCLGCGAALSPASPPQAPRAYTPKHLAEKILTTRSALEGERKQVTVLFADVKGSMDLGEKVDPEEWYRIMDRFFQILSDGVHRFEGTVDKFTGDGIMAIFGAPIAHEDHAQRACYAALCLTEELRRCAAELPCCCPERPVPIAHAGPGGVPCAAGAPAQRTFLPKQASVESRPDRRAARVRAARAPITTRDR